MNLAGRRLLRLTAFPAVLAASTALPRVCSAGDVTAFVALSHPAENWSRGYGAALASTWFTALRLEAEAARIPGDSPGITMTSFTGSAMLAPPIGLLTPYGGVGVGVFRQSLLDGSDLGTLKCLVLGAKLKLGPILVVKGEYRSIRLSGTPRLAMDERISAGAGISF